ncbi:MAG TPA: acetamidase/formamidase family protein, partial [Clostridia bacterium]|nr:acetamidase/formamidase family protein [Clostridia bacterium]
HKVDRLSCGNAPAARCKSGDTVAFETLDCYDGAVSRAGVRTYDKRMANPATGPLFVEGAMPGDALRVDILSIKPAPWGAMGTYFGEGAFAKYPGTYEIRAFELEDGFVTLAGHRLRLDPMIGVIGVAPAGEAVPTVTAGPHGGNMDCSRIVAGATIYFPVSCEGALLAMGDLHALMGDGEVFGYGLEVSGEVEVNVRVVKGMALAQPLLYEGGRAMAVASAKTLDEATNLAVQALYDLLVSRGMDRVEAGMLLSLKCDVAVCQIVDPLLTVRAMIPEEFLPMDN